jgi:hypothetical protein
MGSGLDAIYFASLSVLASISARWMVVTPARWRCSRNLATDGLHILAVTMTDAPLKPWNGEKIVLYSETESCHDQAFPVA